MDIHFLRGRAQRVARPLLSSLLLIAFLGTAGCGDSADSAAGRDAARDAGTAPAAGTEAPTESATATESAGADMRGEPASPAPAADTSPGDVPAVPPAPASPPKPAAAAADAPAAASPPAEAAEAAAAEPDAGAPAAAAGPPTLHTVKGVVTRWEPAVLFVQPGDSVVFKQMIGHDTELVAGMHPEGVTPWKSKLGEEGFTITLTEPGAYVYKCNPHFSMGMIGSIVVGPRTPHNLAAIEAHPENKGMLARAVRMLKQEIEKPAP